MTQRHYHQRSNVIIDTASLFLTQRHHHMTEHQPSVTQRHHQWHSVTITDTVMSSLTQRHYSWHSVIINDTASQSPTQQCHHWLIDTASLFLTQCHHQWHSVTITNAAMSSLTQRHHPWHSVIITWHSVTTNNRDRYDVNVTVSDVTHSQSMSQSYLKLLIWDWRANLHWAEHNCFQAVTHSNSQYINQSSTLHQTGTANSSQFHKQWNAIFTQLELLTNQDAWLLLKKN